MAVRDLARRPPPGRSGRAACRHRPASPAAASGTRTSSRSRTRARARRRPSSAAARARTSFPAAVAPGRWRRKCTTALPMRADRRNWCRAGDRRRCSRSRAGGASCRTGTRSWPSRIPTPAAPGVPALQCARLRLRLRRPPVPGASGRRRIPPHGSGFAARRGLIEPWRQRPQVFERVAGLARERGDPAWSLRRQDRRSMQPARAAAASAMAASLCLISRNLGIVRLGGRLERATRSLRTASCIRFLRRRRGAGRAYRRALRKPARRKSSGRAGRADRARKREQMRREIAAVHRRDVTRSQRLQGLRVVPVVEMSLMALERRHRLKCLRRALDQGAGRDVAEVRGREVREQRDADVGRRRAMRDHRAGLLLEIVGRQPVVLLDHELLEVGPGLARDAAQEYRLLPRQLRSTALQRPAQPPGEDGRRKPKHEDGQGGRQGGRSPRPRVRPRRGPRKTAWTTSSESSRGDRGVACRSS